MSLDVSTPARRRQVASLTALVAGVMALFAAAWLGPEALCATLVIGGVVLLVTAWQVRTTRTRKRLALAGLGFLLLLSAAVPAMDLLAGFTQLT